MKTVRDGKRVWPTCPECGCRLKQQKGIWVHFGNEFFRDARGCKCSYADMGWWPMNHKESIILTLVNRGV